MSRSAGNEVLIELMKFGVITAVGIGFVYFCGPQLMSALLNDGGASKQLKKTLARRLNRPEIELMEFSSHEVKFASDIITCSEIDVTFQDIGGIDDKLDEVRDNIVLPLEMFQILKGKSNLTPSPTGVLLYGKPGTGKTMTAKAIAKEAGATFINVKTSTLMDKYVGETDKLVFGLFSLARKLAPSIIFIDEIDTLLSTRQGSNSGSKLYDTMQGLFLQEWDGLGTKCPNGPVLVLGATNRPTDIDKAFLRRMPFILEIPLPDVKGRQDILVKILSTESMEDDIDLAVLADITEGFSGSDLKELVRVAAMQRIKSLAATAKKNMLVNDDLKSINKKQYADLKADTMSATATTSSSNGIDKPVANTTTAVKEERDNSKKASSTKATTTTAASAAVSSQKYLHEASLCSLRPLNVNDFEYAILKISKSMSSVSEFNFSQWSDDVERLKVSLLKSFVNKAQTADISKAFAAAAAEGTAKPSAADNGGNDDDETASDDEEEEEEVKRKDSKLNQGKPPDLD